MALVKADLADGIEAIGADPPDTAAECAQAWAAAIVGYASNVTPTSTTVAGAEPTLASSLTTAFESDDAAPGMESAMAAFAVTVAGGMAPAFTGTPPPDPVGFAAQFAGAKPETHAEAGSQIADLIDVWMKTGTATPSGGGAPVNWS